MLLATLKWGEAEVAKTADRANDFVNNCSTSCNIEFRIEQGVGSKVSNYLYEKCCD